MKQNITETIDNSQKHSKVNLTEALPLRTLFLSIFLSIFLVSCATHNNQSTILDAAVSRDQAITHKVNQLEIFINPINQASQEFFEDFFKKGILPIRLSIVNTSQNTYTLSKVQYAICDEEYNRTRRITYKDMALKDTEISFQGKISFMQKVTSIFHKNKAKKKYKDNEFSSDFIPTNSSVNGWLYFQFSEKINQKEELINFLKNHQLEIAHIKQLETNIVSNVYIDLADLLSNDS